MKALLAALLIGFFAAPAYAQHSGPAQRVIDRARTAQGGAVAWNGIRGFHEVASGGETRVERWMDPVRYGYRAETKDAAGLLVQGYNGFGEWRILADGQKTGSVDPADMAEIRSDAYFAAYGYFYTGRFDVRSSLLGVRQAQGKSFDVVRIQPAGGEPRELWFDRRTGLLGLIVDETGPRQGRTELSDYRKVGRISAAHKVVHYGGARERPLELTVEVMEFPAADRVLFSLPPEPAP
jgi:hypothetical protein